MLAATPQVLTTIITPAKSYDLTSLNTVKDDLGITDSKKDSVLRRYIASASAAAAQFCNRIFQVETVKDEFFPFADPHPWQVPGGAETLQLSKWPVIAVTSVMENGVALVDGADFRTDLKTGALIRLNPVGIPTRWSPLPVVVQYSGGFATSPSDVEDAIIRMVRARLDSRDRDPYLMSENIPGVRDARWWVATGTQAGNMPPDIIDLLDNYRVPVSV